MSSMYGSKSRRISKLFIQQTGTYNPQYRRAYELNLSATVESKLEEVVASKQAINAVHLIAPDQQLVAPSATPESSIMIVNGWDTPRLRFILVVEIEDHVGTGTVTTLQGYTEYADTSMGGNIDPKMMFFINNVSQSRVVRTRTPLGQMDRHQVLMSNQLIGDSGYHNRGIGTVDKTFSMTPEDVFNNMQNIEMLSMPGFGDQADSMFMDTRSHVTGVAKMSDRKNAIPGQYASTILNTYLGCRATDPDNDVTIANGDFYSTCSSYIANQHTTRDEFLSFLENRRAGFAAMRGSAGSNTFTYNDLLAFDQNVRSVTHVIPNTTGLHSMGQTEGWGGSGPETLFAAAIASAIAGAMHQNNISLVAFRSTNTASFTREISTLFTNVKGAAPNADMTRELQGFKFQLENVILFAASYGNNMAFDVEVMIDLAGDTWINVSLEGQQVTAYVVPTFCDALMTPVVTMDRSRFDALTTNMDSLGNQLYHAANHGAWSADKTIYSWGSTPGTGTMDL